jgi:hypothetical protein
MEAHLDGAHFALLTSQYVFVNLCFDVANGFSYFEVTLVL